MFIVEICPAQKGNNQANFQLGQTACAPQRLVQRLEVFGAQRTFASRPFAVQPRNRHTPPRERRQAVTRGKAPHRQELS